MADHVSNADLGEDPDDRTLADALYGEFFQPAQPRPTSTEKLPGTAEDILAMIAQVQDLFDRSERWQMVTADDHANPLAAAIQGLPSNVKILSPHKDLVLHGEIAISSAKSDSNQADSNVKPDDAGSAYTNEFTLAASSEDVEEVSEWEAWMYSAGKEESDNVGLWEQVSAAIDPSPDPQSLGGKLHLKCAALPTGWTLGDVVVYEQDDIEPLVVLTVRRLEGGYELSYDSADRALLTSDSVGVDLRLLPVEGV